MNALLGVLTALVTALLRTYLEQRGHVLAIEQKVRLEEALKNYEAAKRALAWKAEAVLADRDGRDDLRVREPTQRIVLPGDDPHPGAPSESPPL